MKQLRKLKAKLRSNKQSGQDPANRTGPTSPAQQGSGPSQSFMPDQQFASVEENLSRPGFFAGANNVDARHGVFHNVSGNQYYVAGDQYNMQENEILLLDKLRHVQSAGYQSAHHKTCLPGTRKDELQRIEKWEADYEDKRVYWLNGTAGCGKSTLAKTFAERSFAEGRLGASFFCSRDSSDRRDIRRVFPTLAYQLVFRYPEFRTALIPIISSNPDVGHALPAVQLEHLLVGPLKSTGLFTTIVIDALDECEDMEPASAILSLLGQHIDAIPNVKFLITGRPEPPIRTGFRVPLLQKHTEVFLLHEVDRASVDQDIELYLRTRLSEIVMGRSHCDLTVLWPTDKEITITIKKCSGLFIVASVIVKFVADPNRRPQDRLKIIISDPDNTVYEGKSGVDVTYHQIFVQSFDYIDVDDTEFYEELRLVVGSIVLALNPLSCADLATILDISPESVRIAIRSLHSVLVVPDSDSELLRICHKSFADFLTNSRRCKDKRFYIEPAIYPLEFATSCLNLMKKLERNICDLPPYAMNEDIRDLGQRREKCIGGGLEYACRSWAKHLRSSSSGGYNEHIVKFLEYFFKHNLLSWLEVMSIVGDVGCAIYLLRDAKVWLIDVGLQDTDLFAIVNDSERFVLRFFEAIEESAPHIYDSALLWSPASSLVRALYQNQIPREVKLSNAIEKSWDACTREVQTQSTIALPFNRPTIIFSPKDDLIAVAEDGCVEIFEVMTGKHRAVFKSKTEDSEPRSLAFSPDSMVLMIGYSGGSIDVRDLQTGGLVNCEGHTDMVAFVAFSPCGTMVASCSDDHTIRIWDVPSYDSRCVLEGHSDKVQTACWTGTGSGRVISGSFDGTVRVWDILGEKCLKTFPGHDRLLTVMSSDDSSFIAASSEGTRSDRRLDGTVKVIDAQNGDVIHMIPTEPGTRLTSFSYHDQVMYRTGSTIVMWDFRKNTSVLMFKHDGIGSTISLDRTCTASYHFPNLVKIWQVNSAIKNHDLAHPSIDVYLSCVAFSGDGLLIASGSRGGTVRLWDPISCLCLETFRGHSGVVRSAIFSPDSKLCASSSDHTIQVLDVHARAIVSTINTWNVYDLFRFSPDCSQILSYRPSTYKSGRLSSTTHHLDLWKIETGERLASTQIEGKPEVLAFTGDGTSVTTKFNNSAMEWKISPATASDYQDTDDDNKKDHLLLQMTPAPIHDIHPLSTNVPSHQPYSMDRREWILDERKRRICWVPPDLRRLDFAYNGKTVALGRHSGMITIIDFSGVR